MKSQYIIQIENQEIYPFDGPKPHFTHVSVRTIFTPTKESFSQIQLKLNKILTLKSSALMQISKIIEIRGKRFEVQFQYVSQSLKNSSKMNQISFGLNLKEILTIFYKELAENSIRYQFRMDDIGLTQTGEIKIYTGIRFEVVTSVEREILEEEYQMMVDKFMEKYFNFRETIKSPSDNAFASGYSHKVTKKLSEFEIRLNKMRKYSKQTSSSNPSSKNEQKGENRSIFLENGPTNIKQTRVNTVAAGLTSNSLIHHKNAEETRPHKFSFGDYSTSSNKLDDSSSKESSLTQRITNALEKTEFAFKVYEKYSQKKSRRRA